MTELRFKQTGHSIPQFEAKPDGSFELWITAYDKEGQEQEIFFEIPARVYPQFRQHVITAGQGRMASSDLVAGDPELGVIALEAAYDKGGDLINAWHVIVAGLGRADAIALINEKLGKDKAHAIFKAVKGE